MTVLNKILSRDKWQSSVGKDRLEGSELDLQDGFVHFSTDEQLFKTLEKFYPGKERIVVRVDSSKLVGDLIYETNPGGETKYYHLYEGHIPMESIISIYKIEPLEQ